MTSIIIANLKRKMTMSRTIIRDIENTEDVNIDFEYPKYEEVKDLVLEHLVRQGVQKVVVEFSGGGDEGSVNLVTVYFSDKDKIEIDEADCKNLYNALCSPVYFEFESFAMDGHAEGEVTWNIDSSDVAKCTVILTGQQSYEHWEDLNKEL